MKKKRWREIKDLDGNLLGMEFSQIMSRDEAVKLGYKPKPQICGKVADHEMQWCPERIQL